MSGVDNKKKAFDECGTTEDCKESYLQCVSIDGRNVKKCEGGGCSGICYPLSVAPLASAVETKLIDMQKNIKKNDGDEFGGWRDILGIVGGSIGAIVIIYGMVKMTQYIKMVKQARNT